MDLYIREKEIINLKNDKENFSGDAPDFKFSLSNNNDYQITFKENLTYDNLIAGNKYTILLYFTFFEYLNFDIHIRDNSATGVVLDTLHIDNFKNPMSFEFTALTDTISISADIVEDFTLLKMVIIDTQNINKLLSTTSDFNIIYNLSDTKNLSDITMPYSKSIRIYKPEILKNYFLNLNNRNIQYDALVFRNSMLIFSGDFVVEEYVNDSYYSCVIQSNMAQIKGLSNLNVSEYLNEVVEYSETNYIDFYNNPENYNYGYYNSVETYNEIDNWNPYDSDGRIDFTYCNNQYVQDDWRHTALTKYWNFNTYMRIGVKYHHLFDLAHRLNGWNYELDPIVEKAIKKMYITNPFFKEYDEDEDDVVMTPSFSEYYDVEDGVDEVLVDELIPLPMNISNGIVNWKTKGFTDSSGVVQSNGPTVIIKGFFEDSLEKMATTMSLGLYTLDSSGNKDMLLEEHKITKGISFDNAVTEYTFNWNVEYNYSKYGYGINVYVYVYSPILVDTTTVLVLVNKPFVTSIYKKYVIYRPDDIELKNLIPPNLTFLDTVKNVLNMYNLYSTIDYSTSTIKYKTFSNYFIGDDIDLSKKFDKNSVTIKYEDFNSKLKYAYENPYSKNLNYNNIYYTNLNNDDLYLIDIKATVLYDNVYDNWLFSADFMSNYPYSEYNINTRTKGFEPLSRQNPRSDYGIGFISIEDASTISTCSDWSLNDLGFTKISTISSINKDSNYGIWWNKDEFNQGDTVYKYLKYSDINLYQSLYDFSYNDFNNHIYKYGPTKFIANFYLSNDDITKINNHTFIIINNQRYIVDKMTISNNKTQLELIKYI